MPSIKSWATPLTMGAFLLSAVTGVLMFFHWQTGMNKLAHEWLGWFLIFGGIAHAFSNGRAFKSYFSQPLGKGIISLFILLLAGSFWAFPGMKKSPQAEAMNALSQAPLELVAQVARKDPAQVLKQIEAAGFSTSSLKNSVRTIAGADKQKEKELMGVIFSQKQ